MARYFTRSDRENIIKICTIEGTLKSMIEEMAEHNRPGSWLKGLRTAHTWISKINQSMADESSDEELKKLWKYFQKFEIRMMPQHEAKAIMDQEDLVTVQREGINDMAEGILSSQCDGCTKTDHLSCKYRKALMSCNIPAWDFETPAAQCQYKFNSEEWSK